MSKQIKAPLMKGSWSKFRELATQTPTRECVFKESIIPTRHFQRSLPRLPVPTLTHTKSLFLEEVRPVLSPQDFARATKKATHAFGGALREVNEELVNTDRANLHTSFISSDWFRRSLSNRDPIPLYQYTTWIVRRDAVKENMLVRAACWVFATVIYYKMYQDDTLRPCIIENAPNGYWKSDWFERSVALCPEYFSTPMLTNGSNKQLLPVDISQGDNLFNSSRVPGVLQDEIRAVGFMPHIIVQYRGHQFVVQVADGERNPLPLEQIYARLRDIVMAGGISNSEEIGLLTSLPRSEWSVLRTALLRDPVNKDSLDDVETAMFILNLDEDVGVDFFSAAGVTDKTHAARCTNRWWDKSLSVSVSQNGLVTVGHEHGWGDGVVVRHYLDKVSQFTASECTVDFPRDAAATDGVHRLKWNCTEEVKQSIHKAKSRLVDDVAKLDLHTCVLHSEKSLLTEFSIDSLVQAAIQLAWWNCYSSFVNGIETVNLSHFLRGRCGFVRPLTAESAAFIVAASACGKSTTAGQKQALVRAIQAYEARKKNVMAGNGTDGHLFGLLNTSERMTGVPAPFFSENVYQVHCKPVLQSDPVLRDSGAVLSGFCPTHNGYSVRCSLLDEHALVLSVCAWKTVYGPTRSCDQFCAALHAALNEILKLLQ
ncbi:carnitine O-palmitoyltransferase 2 [Angomonas deanei]|nr:carnitine O-palmitoyltransferase 2 [Angomonas deanei]EPY42537.1 carnitine O-palmitoyltransferase 2 [Angomonas deanei]|eukprot:EPY29173.1 carnitine O-palmitoyltransferase 2 [Angomonas deanei]